ncbi:MAG: type III secretion system cytoplasmic ring protein SctQ [Pseudomonadota bacterium]
MMDRSDIMVDHSLQEASGLRSARALHAEPYDPAEVSASVLSLTNRLSRRRLPATVELGDAVIAFTPRGLGTLDGVPTADCVVFWFLIDGRPLALKMASSLYERLMARIDPELLAADIDQEILPLLLESSAEDGLHAAEASLQSRLELVAIKKGAAIDLAGLNIVLDVSVDGDQAGHAVLRAGRDDVLRLAELFAARAKPPRSFGDLEVGLSFRAAALWLDLGQVRSLKPGDVLLVEEDDNRWERMAATAGEHWLFPLTYADKGPIVQGPFRRADARDREEWMMVDQSQDDDRQEALTDFLKGDPKAWAEAPADAGPIQETPGPAAAPEAALDQPGGDLELDAGPASPPADAAFDDLPIKLVFELGRLDMPLGQLQDVGPGHVFELDRPLGESVEIHAGNRRIGQGDIVRIEDQIGVRITRLFGRREG